MPSRERRERARKALEAQNDLVKALGSSAPTAVLDQLRLEKLAISRAELGSGIGDYSIRGFEFDGLGNGARPADWGKRKTLLDSQLAAEQSARVLKKLAGSDWGNTKEIRQILVRAANASISSVPSSRTLRRYFVRYP